MRQVLYCVRHGLAEHNLLYKQYGEEAYFYKDYIDTNLVTEGIEQARELGNNINKLSELDNLELIIVSPLKRTLETCQYIFKKTNIPIIALEEIREYPCGLHTCNKRHNITGKKNQFKNINFDYIHDNNDLLWKSDRFETIIELDLRIKMFKDFLKTRKEKKIMVISHCCFLSHFMYNNYQELKHCEIYKYII